MTDQTKETGAGMIYKMGYDGQCAICDAACHEDEVNADGECRQCKPLKPKRHATLTKKAFLDIMRERREYPKGSPDWNYRSRAARIYVWRMRDIPATMRLLMEAEHG